MSLTDISHLFPHRILVCQQRQIGDVVIATACVELLARRWPEAEIHFLTEVKCVPVLEHNPHITRIWPLAHNSSLWHTLIQALYLRRLHFDLLIDFQQLPRTGLTALVSNAPVRLSMQEKWYKRLAYTHVSSSIGGYAGKTKASLLKPLGIEWDRQPPRIYLTDDERAWAAAYLQAQGLTAADTPIGVDATHWSPTRRWPEEHWARWIDLCLKARPDLRFILLHGPGERNCVERIAAASRHEDRCILPPQDAPSLRHAAALIDACAVEVGNCSAPRHIAVALGKPTLTTVGSNGDGWTFPDPARHRTSRHTLPCSGCRRNTCPNGTLECLIGLRPETVAQDFLALLTDVAGDRGGRNPVASPQAKCPNFRALF